MKNNVITNSRTETNSKNIYQEITTAIVNKMKEGKLIWQSGYNYLIAQNWTTKTSYTGINYLLLNFVYQHPTCPYYATFVVVISTESYWQYLT